jgi:hypothetical protein
LYFLVSAVGTPLKSEHIDGSDPYLGALKKFRYGYRYVFRRVRRIAKSVY